MKKKLVALLILAVLSASTVLPVLYFSVEDDLPTEEAMSGITHMQASEVYSADGQLVGRYYLYDRTPVAYEDIPQAAIEALVSTEDVRFYDHHGVDWRSLPRVLFKTILLGDASAGGGSTITQQLAKNLYPRKDYEHLALVRNKIREMRIARALERIYSKQEILTLYFNTVPFGSNAFGIQAAAHRYFNKDCSILTVEECAVLIGLLKATSYYNPVQHPDRAHARRNTVLRQMGKAGFLSETQYDSLSALPMVIAAEQQTTNSGIAPYFLERFRPAVTDILDSIASGQNTRYNLFTDGLRIRTTLDSHMQRYAAEAVAEHLSRLQHTFEMHWKGQRPPWHDPVLEAFELKKTAYMDTPDNTANTGLDIDQKREMEVFSWEGIKKMEMSPLDSIRYYLKFLHAGFVVLDNNSGAIRAWVGGIDFSTFPYDHVHMEARRQVGSVFKPIVYASALEQGISPCAYIRAEQETFSENGKEWTPGNADKRYEGKYSMEGGLMHSVNTVSVKILEESGIDNCISLARKMGIRSDLPPYPSIALGTPSISLLEMAAAYTTFANGGQYHVPFAILSIEDRQGNVIWKAAPNPASRAMKEETAIMIREMLRGVVNDGTGVALRTVYGLKNDLAGKTGTTQNNADGWFIASSPDITAAAWVGASYPSIHFRSTALGQGAKTALPLVGIFFRKLTTDTKYATAMRRQFTRPSARLLSQLDCEPFREEFKLFEWLFGNFKKDDKGPEKDNREGGFFKKIGSIFKKKENRQ